MQTAYRIHLSNGTNYATNMAAGITLEQARKYFLGRVFVVSEDAEGKETEAQVIAVGNAVREAHGNCDRCCQWVVMGEDDVFCEPCKVKSKKSESGE